MDISAWIELLQLAHVYRPVRILADDHQIEDPDNLTFHEIEAGLAGSPP